MEKNSLSYRGKVRLSLYISAVILVLGIIGITESVRANKYERIVTNTRQMALVSLDECLGNISSNLEKIVYTGTPSMLSRLSSELWRETTGAKNSLAILPTGEISLDNTYKFLSQVGEFVMSLQRKASRGEKLSDEEQNKLKDLYEYSVLLNEQVTKMCRSLENGSFEFEVTDSTVNNIPDDILTANGAFDDVEQSLSDLPSLIYDGPFSNHIEQSELKFLQGLDEVNKNEALKVAEQVCNNETLKYSYDENGNIPCYVFTSDNCTVAITKTGGKPLYMLSSQFAGEILINYDDAVKNARDYLEKIGYKNMKESYYFTDDGVCTVNFAAQQDGVVLYPDLIKVSVNLQNGKIMAFDATGYISNHTERNTVKPKISENEAIGKINSHLTVISTGLCLIPTEWKTEQYCYEIHCKTDNGRELLVYVDCVTGNEDNILILLYNDGGVLTK